MKILLIHNRYYHVSGPETYLFNLKHQLEIQGHEVEIFSERWWKIDQHDYLNKIISYFE